MIAGYGIRTTTISAEDDVRSALVDAWNEKGSIAEACSAHRGIL
jgi:hypothetical protein